jgi:2-methylcitrate dehydratase PrpD
LMGLHIFLPSKSLHSTRMSSAVAAGASFIDPDAAAWINSAAADILDTETTVENFLGKALPWNW